MDLITVSRLDIKHFREILSDMSIYKFEVYIHLLQVTIMFPSIGYLG